MIGGYLNSKAILIPVSMDTATGGETKGIAEELQCQVVDDTRIRPSSGNGRELEEGIQSVVIVPKDAPVKEGDLLRVTEIRGVSVTKKARVVRSVNIVGGFTASHKEVLI